MTPVLKVWGRGLFRFELDMRYSRMPFPSIVAEPHELAKLAAAFDAAWIGVNSVHTIGTQSQNRARARLAEIILELWRENPEQLLGARAVERFLSDQPPTD